ncbi:hypothetical protein [Paenibacillus azoreducens]|uniref:Uncharacterized protein n=1 Tax=Paenibacillus azoreducens TaxID=116718 RepID=A0A920CQ70_9BACL|nr:hypothetical protein [Paenibacillus azoreducens]GIO45699.1 hypothetical protein J34TS1_04640 [Paenibacillus azoreducens]
MLDVYTFQKLLEYDQADRNNHQKRRIEQEKNIISQLDKEKNSQVKWYSLPRGIFRKTYRRQRYRT